MDFPKFLKKMEPIAKSLEVYKQLFKVEVSELIGKCVKIGFGKYQGRWGKVMGFIMSDNSNSKIALLVLPFDLKRKDGSLIFQNYYTRTYTDIEHFSGFKDEFESWMVSER